MQDTTLTTGPATAAEEKFRLISGTLEMLPASLDWMVLFRLDVLRPFGDSAIRAMFHLPEDHDLRRTALAVLTSAGKFTLEPEGLVPVEGAVLDDPAVVGSLAGRYARQLALVDPDTAICVGVGEQAPFPPVLLHVRSEGRVGHATALFEREPSAHAYDLLPAIGVRYLGGEHRGGLFVASFEHRLPTHLEAGRLSAYERTGHCNEFFLRHGNIDRDLEVGLIRAASARIAAGARRASEWAAALAGRACAGTLAMSCEPPSPAEPFDYGDLVPLGLLSRALQGRHPALRDKLLAARQQGLWPFHTGRLITATDSALVLQGLELPESVEALERFSDGAGGYYPQLWGPVKTADRMAEEESTRHWCQPDFATTCLVRALRRRANLPERTPLSWIEERFESRSGLYFANPYFTDWCTAEALRRDPRAEELRQRLVVEILASANPDGTFGRYDAALSTSFAILALTAAGYRGRAIMIAQLRLIEMADFAPATAYPFYSSLLLPEARGLAFFASDGREIRPGWVVTGGDVHEVTLYRDAHRVIGTAAAAMALAENSFPRSAGPGLSGSKRHPRYGCGSPAAYAGKVALAPYVKRRAQAGAV